MSAYRRVAVDEQRRGAQSSDDESANSHGAGPEGGTSRRTRAERATDKLHALAWILAAYLTSSTTHFFTTLRGDERIIRPLFYTAMSMFGMNTLLLLVGAGVDFDFEPLSNSLTLDCAACSTSRPTCRGDSLSMRRSRPQQIRRSFGMSTARELYPP